MEAVFLHCLYVVFGLGTVYMVSNAYKHRNECEMKKATSLASIEADGRLLASHNPRYDEDDTPPHGTPAVAVPQQKQTSTAA